MPGEQGKVRDFHQARWNEPIVFELSCPGERGILIPPVDEEVSRVAGDVLSRIPPALRRRDPPALPEMAQARVLRHYLRLSQETLGADLNVDIGQGTCTMKYSPKINERLARLPQMTEIHPLQPPQTVQGILRIMYEFEQMLKAISGLDRFSFQPGGGSQAIFAMACMVRAYHESRGEFPHRNEIVTTIFSHPSNAAAAAVAGFKVITVFPGPDGYPDWDAFREAVSPRTAAFFVTNPEDTGIFNPRIRDFTRLVHDAGGLCAYDQANANGILGITRAREAEFDLCFFNLHKSFSAPHGCGGPGTGAVGVVEKLAPFLPVPVVETDGEKYWLDYDRPLSIGKVREFYGVPQVVLKSYAWVLALGADGLREVARVAVLNSNYLLRKVSQIRGVAVPYAPGKHRMEQVRYSWEPMTRETGVTSEEVGRRMADFGFHYWTSHHPWIVPEPFTLEPTESYSKAELDEYIAALEHVSREAYVSPETVKQAPHRSTIHTVDTSVLDDPQRWAVTWRAYRKKVEKGRHDAP